MKTQLDTFLEGQKKIWEFWTDTSQKVMQQFQESVGGQNKKASESKETASFLNPWIEAQKKLWEQTMEIGNLKEAYQQTPEKFEQWMKLQTDAAQKWMDFYKENVTKLGVNPPKTSAFPPMDAFNFMPSTPKEWLKWMEKSQEWMQKSLLDKLPFPQGFHYQNFNDLYQGLFQYWTPLQQMMEHGIADWRGIEAFFKPDAYREMVGQFMGFKPITDLSALLKDSNQYFDYYLSFLEDMGVETSDWQQGFTKMFSQMPTDGTGTSNPIFQVILQFNETVRENMESLYNVAGQKREVEMAKLVKDIQFTYTAFILKTVDMQSKVFQASQFALPDTLKDFSQKLQKGEKLPDYQTFFYAYVNDFGKIHD